MKIIEAKNARVEKRSDGVFDGTVEMTPLINMDAGSKEFTASIVTFPPGVRSKFHMHTHEQVLYVIFGKGIVATKDEERIVNLGDTILIPAGETHKHGATDDSTFAHLYFTIAGMKTKY